MYGFSGNRRGNKRFQWSKGESEFQNDNNRHYPSKRPVIEYRPKVVAKKEDKEKAWRLPIDAKREEILDKIENSNVVVINGRLGCGKSTQVPQYIYEHYRERGERVNIICTQPRRIAAISIAKRVTFEMSARHPGVHLGGLVGYQVGLNPNFNRETCILFMTTGIFLQRLIHERNLDQYTHVILDEIHERDLDTDFSMIAIKYLLHESTKAKIILMSATFDTKLFSDYFSQGAIKNIEKSIRLARTEERPKPVFKQSSGWSDEEEEKSIVQEKPSLEQMQDISGPCTNPASIVTIEEQKFELIYHYLNEFGEIFNNKDLSLQVKNMESNFDSSYPAYLPDCVGIASDIIVNQIHIGNYLGDKEMEKKTVLVFVPGYAEIFELIDCIDSICTDKTIREQLHILPLHSSIPDKQQDDIFASMPFSSRKVIIGTNIAESSITIPDLSCVIDFCLSKENHVNSSNNERLELHWASQASCNQRAGRAGRVGNGQVFRLVPKSFFPLLNKFTTPEIRRSSLDKLILQIKTWNYKEPHAILGAAIDPPELQEVQKTVGRLQNAGAITLPTPTKPTGDLTYLGRLYCEIPCDIKITKFCMYGLVFCCMKEAIIMGAVMQQDKSLFLDYHNYIDPEKLNHKFSFGEPDYDSDLIVFHNAFEEWSNYRYGHSGGEVFRWCRERGINTAVMFEAERLVGELKQRFHSLGVPYELSQYKNGFYQYMCEILCYFI